MEFLEVIKQYKDSKKIAFINSAYQNEDLSFEEIITYSDKLAAYIQDRLQSDKSPIVVYGHKHPFMIIFFLASVKSGRAFCPVDISMPRERVNQIIDKVDSKIILATETLDVDGEIIDVDRAKSIIAEREEAINDCHYVKGDDDFYILFTSGSTGEPKGVRVSYSNLNHFLDWYTSYYDWKDEHIFLGHPPFSFDLSVMSLWPSFVMHSTIVQINHDLQTNYNDLFNCYANSNASIWISTPSFVDTCLLDPSFNHDLLPNLKQFIFCGERLFNSTVSKLHERFPGIEVINTYGPTESTVMVTWLEVTEELNQKYSTALPVGFVKEGTQVVIDDIGLIDGRGEIIIMGDTVANGYFKNETNTKKSFFDKEIEGKVIHAYRTGDIGYFSDGMLFCEGRLDFQIKLHGYRIELDDIDSNLLKIDKILKSASIPKEREGEVKSITTFIVYEDEIENRFKVSKHIKAQLKELVPDYMIPKKIVFLDEMPVNNNGKIDKKKLKEL